MNKLVQYWYQNHWSTYLLRPFSWLYLGAVNLRRYFYHHGWKKSVQLPVPVIVVGNITVGGTGKTPLVAWIVKCLRDQGYKPGLVSRGYGGKAKVWPQVVMAHSDPKIVGDEAVMLVRQTHCPMVVAPNRVQAAQQLLAEHDCNVIISDDGLQHYALQRDLEIAVIDGQRRFGNECCLPAGPLRESKNRLRGIDFVITNGMSSDGEYAMEVKPRTIYNLLHPEQELCVDERHPQTVHAVAAIGNPERFFALLASMGFRVIPHPYPDHYALQPKDIQFGDDAMVIMTEKDAVKCQGFADEQHWCLAVVAQPEVNFRMQLEQQVRALSMPQQ